jgi:hypothetical protein
MVAGLGFEPRQTESESVVLPLHNPALSAKLIIIFLQQFVKIKIAKYCILKIAYFLTEFLKNLYQIAFKIAISNYDRVLIVYKIKDFVDD